MNIEKKLALWVENKLLTKEQSQSIFNFEKENAQTKPNKFLFSILLLGVIVLTIGIISLIAVNWWSISDFIKQLLAILILIALSVSAYYAQAKNKNILFEILITTINLFILCCIGLIGQIYNLSGSWSQTLLLWTFIAAGPVFLSQKTINYLIWCLTMLAGLVIFLAENDTGSHYFIFSIPIIFSALIVFLKKRKILKPFNQALSITCFWLTLANIYFSSLINMLSFAKDDLKSLNFGIIFALCGVLMIFLNRDLAKQRKILYTIILIIYTLFSFKIFTLGLAASIMQILFLTALAILFAMNDNKRYFNIVIFLAGLNFFSIYLRVFGTLMATGFGLIISGLVIIGIAYLLYKYNDKLKTLARSFDNEK